MKAWNKGLICAAALVAASSSWSFDVTSGNLNADTSNLLRNSCGFEAASGTGTSVTGCLGGETVNVSSIDAGGAESLFISGGQATVTGSLSTPQVTDAFSGFSVSFADPGDLISKAVINISAVQSGFIQFSDGTNTSGYLALNSNGNNFFTVTGDAYDTLFARTFVQAAGVYQETDLIGSIAQIRLGMTTAVPEPESYALMAGGLAILGFLGRRRRNG